MDDRLPTTDAQLYKSDRLMIPLNGMKEAERKNIEKINIASAINATSTQYYPHSHLCPVLTYENHVLQLHQSHFRHFFPSDFLMHTDKTTYNST
jgi:hypothetical protein